MLKKKDLATYLQFWLKFWPLRQVLTAYSFDSSSDRSDKFWPPTVLTRVLTAYSFDLKFWPLNQVLTAYSFDPKFWPPSSDHLHDIVYGRGVKVRGSKSDVIRKWAPTKFWPPLENHVEEKRPCLRPQTWNYIVMQKQCKWNNGHYAGTSYSRHLICNSS